MIEIEAPDGTIVEFPAGTPRDVMTQAMRRRYGSPQMQPEAAQAPQNDWQPDFEVTSTAPAPAAPPLPLPPPSPPRALGTGERIAQGLGDLPQGGAQFLTNMLPESMVSGVNRATEAVNNAPVIGPLTRALGMTPATREQITGQTMARERAYEDRRLASGDSLDNTDWGRLGGQALSSVGAGLLMAAPRTMAGAALSGAFSGGVQGGLQPVTNPNLDYGTAVAENAGISAGLGAVAGPVGLAIGRAIAPRVAPGSRELYQAGVEMTPGQMLGGRLRSVENTASSIPVIGGAIQNAQRRSIETFNRATANRVLRPLGASVPNDVPVGRELLQRVEDITSNAYNSAIARVTNFGPDAQFSQDLQRVAGRQFLTPQARQQFVAAMQQEILPLFNGPTLDGRTYQLIKSELGRLARAYQGSAAPAERGVAAALEDMQDVMKSLLMRRNPGVAWDFRAADEAYAGLIRMQTAASGVGAVDGVFTPAQLQNAVKRGDTSLRDTQFARGDALLQDFSDAGRSVLPSNVPNSGTADRALLAALLTAPATTAGLIDPITATAMGAAAGAYSRPGAQALARYLMARPGAVRQGAGDLVARSGAGYAVPLGALMLAPPVPQ